MMRISKIFIAICLIWYLFCISCCSDKGNKWPHSAFSSNEWKSTPAPQRYFYFNSLIENKILDNLTQKEVISLLGQPDYKSPDGKYITYILKYAEKNEYSFNSIYLLHIDFDKDGKVVKYFVRAD